jgi:hypothetical protein
MIEVLKQALEALKDVGVLTDREWQAVHKNKANELRQAIAELESQEPIAWVAEDVCEGQYIDGRPRKIWWECEKGVGTAFYTHPSQRTWVGLTGEERGYLYASWRFDNTASPVMALIQHVEAKLKEKNSA